MTLPQTPEPTVAPQPPEYTYYYALSVAPDLRNGSGYYKTFLVRVLRMTPEMPVSSAMLDYCYRNYGRPLAHLPKIDDAGDQRPVANWVLRESTQAEYDACDTRSKVDGEEYLPGRLTLYKTRAGGGLEPHEAG
jgi:hypothetical protein